MTENLDLNSWRAVLRSFSMVTFLMMLAFVLGGCGAKETSVHRMSAASIDSSATEIVSEDKVAGAITAKVKAGGSKPQTVTASDGGEIALASVIFPASSFATDTEVTIEPGVALANDFTLQYFDRSGAASVERVGPVVVLKTATEGLEPQQPLTYSIPAPPAAEPALGTADPNIYLVVLYKYAVGGGEYLTGFIGRDKVTIDKGRVVFRFGKVGAFQAAILSGALSQGAEAKIKAPIFTKREDAKAAKIAWTLAATLGKDAQPNFSFTIAGLTDIDKCIITIDRDKKPPFDRRVVLNQGETSHSAVRVVVEKHDLFARFLCSGKNGRISGDSQWSDGVSVPGSDALVALLTSSGTTDFGNVVIGALGTTQITIKNDGLISASNLSWSLMDKGLAKSADTCGAEIAAGASCTVSFAFSPSAAEDTVYSPVLTYGGTKTLQMSLKGKGVSAAVLTLADPGSFGSVTIGQTLDKIVTLANSGGVAATAIAVSGLTAPFAQQATTCGTSLAAGASCTITVRLTPPAAQNYTNNLIVNYNNGAVAKDLERSLSGAGVP